MVKIRLARGGSKKHPFFHIVVTDSRQSRDGRYIERLGYYNPMPAGNDVPLKLNDEKRVEYWISQGAQPSLKVENLIKQAKETAPTTESADPAEAIA